MYPVTVLSAAESTSPLWTNKYSKKYYLQSANLPPNCQINTYYKYNMNGIFHYI